ncbi:MAG: hypothetical protein Q7J07_08230 [Pelolinea sp.]|nr:hypothetical protein [Pelolinea sp.]
MAKTLRRTIMFALIGVFVLLSRSSCFIFGGQTIYQDPEHVDFNVEDGDAIQSPEQGTDEQSTEEDHTVAEQEDTYFEHGGVQLYYDPQLILDVQPHMETIPACSGGEPYEVAHPEFVHFDLYMEQAHVYIVPLAEYETAADFAPDIIADLRALINDPESLSGCVPELPLGTFYRTCDHQQFSANFKQLDFANGFGLRFVAVYAIQDFAPVDNEHLIYVFQGFTNDNKYYVKIFVRLLHSQLPDVSELPAEVYHAEDQEQVDQYFDGFTELLNTSEADYSPKLDWIDNFISVLSME